jgi:histidinol-phosphate aminotransferase
MYKVNPYIENLYRVGPHEGRKSYLRLDMNENPRGLPQEFFDRVIARLTPSLLAMYPESGKLIQKLSTYLNVEASKITVTNGSDDAIRTVFDVFGGFGKTLISVYPTFEMYKVYAQMFGMKHCLINYDKDFRVSVEEILAAINENVSIVALLNPNNPIGTVYSVEEAEAIIKKARSFDAVVILDEAYYYFYDKTFIDLVQKFDNVILTRTFSKLCSIAGARIGYAVAHPEIIKYMNNARPTYSINTVALEFAYAILDDSNLIRQLIEEEREGRDYLIHYLDENRYEYISENGNFVFIKPKGNLVHIDNKLKENGILVKTYSNDLLKDYLRVTTGGKPEMKIFLDQFLKIDSDTNFI